MPHAGAQIQAALLLVAALGVAAFAVFMSFYLFTDAWTIKNGFDLNSRFSPFTREAATFGSSLAS